MPEKTDYAPGTFCWADLATTDAAAAKAFYTDLFGWTASDQPTDAGFAYTLFEKAGKRVCGGFAMTEAMLAEAPQPYWHSHVAVADVDAAVARVAELGGTVIDAPMDVMDAGRMAVISDPTGAVLGLWEAGRHKGAGLVNEPGTLCWNELYTTDPALAAAFYSGLFGWTTTESTDADGASYTQFHSHGEPAAGMLRIREEWGPMPPNWAVYFAVADLEAALATVRTHGGRVEMGPMAIEGIGTFALVADPQGAYFLAIELAPMG